MPIDRDLQPFIAALAEAFPEPPETLPIVEYRARMARLSAARKAAPPARISTEDRWIEGVATPPLRVRIYRPVAEGGRPGLVYFHGGGWALGSVDDHDPIVGRLAVETGAVLVSADYRLAPEHPFPAPLADAVCAVRWVAAAATELGIDLARLSVGGDSAGGNLAAAAALQLRDEGGPPLLGQVLVYPALDDNFNTPSFIENADGPFLTRSLTRHFWNLYTAGQGSQGRERLAPLRAEALEGLPAAIILSAAHDPLRDEAGAYAAKLRRACVAVRYRCGAGMIHGFLRAVGISAAARAEHDWLVSAYRELNDGGESFG